MKSSTGAHDAPPLVVLKMPPPTLPANITLRVGRIDRPSIARGRRCCRGRATSTLVELTPADASADSTAALRRRPGALAAPGAPAQRATGPAERPPRPARSRRGNIADRPRARMAFACDLRLDERRSQETSRIRCSTEAAGSALAAPGESGRGIGRPPLLDLDVRIDKGRRSPAELHREEHTMASTRPRRRVDSPAARRSFIRALRHRDEPRRWDYASMWMLTVKRGGFGPPRMTGVTVRDVSPARTTWNVQPLASGCARLSGVPLKLEERRVVGDLPLGGRHRRAHDEDVATVER